MAEVEKLNESELRITLTTQEIVRKETLLYRKEMYERELAEINAQLAKFEGR